MLKKILTAAAALATLAVLTAAPSAAQSQEEITKTYSVNASSLNGSGTAITGSISVTGTMATVNLNSTGLSPADAPHAQHLHGDLMAVNVCPTAAADMNGDGLIDTAEGIPSYGGIQVSLTTSGDTSADSALAVERFPVSENGSYTYSRTFEVTPDVANRLANLHIVNHGIDLNDSGEYDGEARSSLTDAVALEVTIPASCGQIRLTDIDLPAPYANADGREGTVARLYVSMLNRAPEANGFAYWVDQLESGVSVRTIAVAFADSPEFRSLYGDMLGSATNTEWVDFVYGAMFGRNADVAGRQYWVNQIERGRLTQAQMLVNFAQSPEFKGLTGTS